MLARALPARSKGCRSVSDEIPAGPSGEEQEMSEEGLLGLPKPGGEELEGGDDDQADDGE